MNVPNSIYKYLINSSTLVLIVVPSVVKQITATSLNYLLTLEGRFSDDGPEGNRYKQVMNINQLH